MEDDQYLKQGYQEKGLDEIKRGSGPVMIVYKKEHKLTITTM